jgi:UDP-N-acetylglucosamine 2-epimerase (non-hydrolysing)
MRIVSVVGTRPNFVKIAPLIREMARYPEISPTLVHTGQHYDASMSAQFFTELSISPADFNLDVRSGSHAVQTAEVMRRLDPILEETRPDILLVVGDVNSTLAAALTAVKRGIPIAHVEAGLRSFDRTMPEEINRLLTDAISEWLFVTEESGRENLLREGRPSGNIHFVGNVMIDALQMFKPRWEASPIFERLGIDAGRAYAVLTLHRPSNVDDPAVLANLLEALARVAREIPIMFPVHPRIRERLDRQGHVFGTASGSGEPYNKAIICLDPLGYLDFIALLSRARLVLTDSGGIQEETTVLGVPCLTLRATTERPVTVAHGTNRVIGTEPGMIVREALTTLGHAPVPSGPPPLWDGRAAERIVKTLISTG